MSEAPLSSGLGYGAGGSRRAALLNPTAQLCALCGDVALGYAAADGKRLCHANERSCYHRWTVYGERPVAEPSPGFRRMALAYDAWPESDHDDHRRLTDREHCVHGRPASECVVAIIGRAERSGDGRRARRLDPGCDMRGGWLGRLIWRGLSGLTGHQRPQLGALRRDVGRVGGRPDRGGDAGTAEPAGSGRAMRGVVKS
jgi:hypothetical protein